MTVIVEEEEDESIASSKMAEKTPIVKPPVVKPEPKPALHTAQTMAAKPKPVVAKPLIKQQTMTAVSQIKTSNRRVSNIDRLKMELAVR